ncbi:hypothetical protein TRAPUB_9181, partial [Trametes pubescens]
HHHVYEDYKLLHRDISAGNVLILPRLVEDPHGKEVVQWHGLLTDWELAKPYLDDRSEEKARQPERTLAKKLLEDMANPPNGDMEVPFNNPALPRFTSDLEDWGSPPVDAVPPREATVPPTEETRALTALLDKHNWVLDLFLDVRRLLMIPPSEWVGTWVIQDQLVGYEHSFILMKKVATTFQTGTRGTDKGANKCPRNAGSNFTTSSSQLPDTDSSGLS